MTATPAAPHAEPVPAVELRGASVALGRHRVWSDLNVRVVAGEFVAVLGPNGVGKSTMIKVLLGLVPLSAGTVEVLGHRPDEVRRRIGYLPQRRTFDPSLRVRGIDIVRLGVDGDRWGVSLPFAGRARRRAAAERVEEVIDLVEATGYAHRPIGQMSGGEQQRLLIAQALATRPDLLLLDEPLDSLDLPNQGAVAALVRRICRDEGVTVLLVAHDVNPILSYLDRVIYLGRGGAAIGAPADVITGEILTRLYDSPIEVLTTSDGRLVVVGEPGAPSHHTDRHVH
jgi:zinc/manganese transport system ATP-binding protein